MNRLHFTSAILATTAALSAQGWTNINPPVAPAAAYDAAMVYDVARGKTILYGGYDGFTSYMDTWEWDGTNWTQVITAANPGDRDSQGMCYDLARGKTVFFGGWDTAGTLYNDTWEYDGTNWTQVVTANSPSPRIWSRMVYDIARGKCVLYGGFDLTTSSTETWEYDGTNWTLISTAANPGDRDSHAMVYDLGRAKTVFFGGWDTFGTSYNDTWEYDGTNWVQVTTANSPSPRFFLASAFDVSRGVTVMHGGWDGSISTNGTWEYDGTDWTLVTSAGPGRDSHAMAYDLARTTTVTWGGFDAIGAITNETWEYTGSATPTWVPFGTGCPGSVGTPALAPQAGSVPKQGTTFTLELTNLQPAGGIAYMIVGFDKNQWNGIPLPLNLASFGLTGCTGYVAPDTNFSMVLLNIGGTATWSVAVPALPVFTGVKFFNQGASFDSGAPNGKMAFSNAGEGTIN